MPRTIHLLRSQRMSCEAWRGAMPAHRCCFAIFLVKFPYRENYNLVVIARLEFRGCTVCLRGTTRYLRMAIWMVCTVGLSKEDKFSIKYSTEYTWLCITLNYEKKKFRDFLRFQWSNAEIFSPGANIMTNECDSLFLPALSIANSSGAYHRHMGQSFFSLILEKWYICSLFVLFSQSHIIQLLIFARYTSLGRFIVYLLAQATLTRDAVRKNISWWHLSAFE